MAADGDAARARSVADRDLAALDLRLELLGDARRGHGRRLRRRRRARALGLLRGLQLGELARDRVRQAAERNAVADVERGEQQRGARARGPEPERARRAARGDREALPAARELAVA